MRTYLRGLAAIQTQLGTVLMVVTVFAAVAALVAGEGYWVAQCLCAAALFAALASVGGILWCLTRLTLPPPGPSPNRRPMRFWLRVLAQVQMGAGLMLTVAATVYASDHLLVRPWRDGRPLAALAVLFVSLGLIGVGAVLWCAVRVAYPERRTAAK
jgi:hypothetical protein